MTREHAQGNWTLRPIEQADAEGLYTLFQALTPDARAAFHPHPFDRATANAIAIGHRIEGPVWIAQEPCEGNIEGYGFLSSWITAWPGLGVAVHPATQGQGLGTALVRQLVTVAREAGKAGVHLTVYTDNTPAVKAYRAVGFRVTRDLFFMEVDFGSETFHENLRTSSWNAGESLAQEDA